MAPTDPIRPQVRRWMLLPAAAALVSAAWFGLTRMGWALPLPSPQSISLHGPLMVSGLFGTLISLERAVAVGARWTYLGPLAGAVGTLLALAGWVPASAIAFCVSALVLLAASGAVIRKQSEVFTWVMAGGAGLWLGGNVLWALNRPLFEVVAYWLGFLVLTIAAERLELSRLVKPPAWARHAFVALAVVFVVTLIAAQQRVMGAAMLLLALWLARFDVARRTVKLKGLPRYAAVALLSGYAWLGTAGALFLFREVPPVGPIYDAALHAVFVGFVLSMVFAHAPIILPAVARLDIPFNPALYAPLLALHASLLMRVYGDLAGSALWRKAGGMGNALAILLFGATVVTLRLLKKRSAAAATAQTPAGLSRS